MNESLLGRLQRFDDERPSFPGEHWIALGAGLWLLTRRSDTLFGRLASLAAGAALVCRAASGRDGVVRLLSPTNPLRRLANHGRNLRAAARYVDLAPPWPYTQRARVSAISQPLGESPPVAKTIWTP